MNQTQHYLDRQITNLYTTPKLGAISKFCKKFSIPRHIVRRRAIELGLAQPSQHGPKWSEEEIKLLKDNCHKSFRAISGILERRGYKRSETAIESKKRRLGLYIHNIDVYSASGLANIMGIDDHTIANWVAKGLLKATRKDSDCKNSTYQILPKDVRDFIKSNVAIVDLRKVDKFWLVDLLTGE